MSYEIDYSKIDKECVGLVRFFNSEGLTTEFSCEGHQGCERSDFFILFSDKVLDQKMINFVYKSSTTLGYFMKWFRPGSDATMRGNWMYLITNNTPETNHEWAKIDLKNFLGE